MNGTRLWLLLGGALVLACRGLEELALRQQLNALTRMSDGRVFADRDRLSWIALADLNTMACGPDVRAD
jgi:hypothetical protein